jgi:DNA-binding NarL/FixJ family response regulator
MKSGASACMTKDSDPEYLLDIIRVVAQGSHPIMEELLVPGLASRVLTEFGDLAALSAQLDNMLARLAPSESDILKSIAAGNGIEQVVAELGTNEENIRRNLRLILNKLVANDQSRALIEAAQRSMPLIIGGVSKTVEAATEYVTKEEFNKFKESLDQRLKIFTG